MTDPRANIKTWLTKPLWLLRNPNKYVFGVPSMHEGVKSWRFWVVDPTPNDEPPVAVVDPKSAVRVWHFMEWLQRNHPAAWGEVGRLFAAYLRLKFGATDGYDLVGYEQRFDPNGGNIMLANVPPNAKLKAYVRAVAIGMPVRAAMTSIGLTKREVDAACASNAAFDTECREAYTANVEKHIGNIDAAAAGTEEKAGDWKASAWMLERADPMSFAAVKPEEQLAALVNERLPRLEQALAPFGPNAYAAAINALSSNPLPQTFEAPQPAPVQADAMMEDDDGEEVYQ